MTGRHSVLKPTMFILLGVVCLVVKKARIAGDEVVKRELQCINKILYYVKPHTLVALVYGYLFDI